MMLVYSLLVVFWIIALLGCCAALQYPPLLSLMQHGKTCGPVGVADRPQWAEWLYNPRLYIRNGIGFTLYYLVALLVNSLIIWEFFVLLIGRRRFALFDLLATEVDITTHPDTLNDDSALLVILLMQIQLIRRLVECLCVHVFSDHTKQNVLVTIAGLGFYVCASLTPLIDSSLFVTPPPHFFLMRARHVIGITLFSVAWFMQLKQHKTLADLRTPSYPQAYSIPMGGLFEYVSAPHYLCEIVIYFSFVVCRGMGSLLQWLEFAFVAFNLTITAIGTHNWYCKKFPHYARYHRRALIPYLL